MNLSYLSLRGFLYYRKTYLFLALIVALISGIISASLLSGYSVRQTLIETSNGRLNGGGIMISSGLRNMETTLADDISADINTIAAPLMSLTGVVKNFASGTSVHNSQIFGIDSSFLEMGGASISDMPSRGEAVVNARTASALGLQEGDQIILRFAAPGDIPSNAPFSPDEEDDGSLFLTVRKIAHSESYANFNPGISQVIPYNVFINIDEFNRFFDGFSKCNRILISRQTDIDLDGISDIVKRRSVPEGIGLKVRLIRATGATEIISDRIFIDQYLTDEIVKGIDGAEPLLTYLANSIESEKGETPYSFISAIGKSEAPSLTGQGSIVINRWLADDLSASVGDSLTVRYYVTGESNELIEKSSRFRITLIVDQTGLWGDSLLMPSFPGITGTRSCTQWDAGIPLDMDRIREKDEQYWYDFAGTPKAFISYEEGVRLWGNQFGPSTAIRFPAIASEDTLLEKLKSIEPIGAYGLVISNPAEDGLLSASSGVDFSSLFLSLSFFIIVAALVLLVMLIDNHIANREGEIRTLTAIGFGRKKVRNLFFIEALVPVTAGAMAGTLFGIAFNYLIITALNSVWSGAVQTDTLKPFIGLSQLATGFVSTIFVSAVTFRVRLGSYLKRFGISIRKYAEPGMKQGKMIFLAILILTVVPFALLLTTDIDKTMLFFAGGTMMLLLSLAGVRAMVQGRLFHNIRSAVPDLSLEWYRFKPSRYLTPLLFISAGLFIVIATGANRRDFSGDYLRRTSGTGGYSHWIETSTPVSENIEINSPIKVEGADGISFMQCLRVDGDDASCLNLNYITAPHILGVDAEELASRGSFSFASGKTPEGVENMWEILKIPAGENAIYGFLDQSVMQWGMKLKPGDTVTVKSESGVALHIIIAGGLNASVFQGYLVVDRSIFPAWWPSVGGSQIILSEENSVMPDSLVAALQTAFEPYGAIVETTTSRLSSFNRVTNTYLSVFMVLGGLGMILGVTGLGLNLAGNVRSRRRELALLTASGFSYKRIRKMLFREHFFILLAGILSGCVPALVATIPSLDSGNGASAVIVLALITLMFLAGTIATLLSLRSVTREKIVTALRKD